MAGQPKAPFYLAVFLVIVGLVGFAWYRMRTPEDQAQQNDVQKQPPVNVDAGPPVVDGQPVSTSATGDKAEAPDAAGITTVKEYTFKPSERLPAVKGVAAYKPLQNNTVRFALNVWAGWAPIIHANNGFKADKVWKTPDGKDFREN